MDVLRAAPVASPARRESPQPPSLQLRGLFFSGYSGGTYKLQNGTLRNATTDKTLAYNVREFALCAGAANGKGDVVVALSRPTSTCNGIDQGTMIETLNADYQYKPGRSIVANPAMSSFGDTNVANFRLSGDGAVNEAHANGYVVRWTRSSGDAGKASRHSWGRKSYRLGTGLTGDGASGARDDTQGLERYGNATVAGLHPRNGLLVYQFNPGQSAIAHGDSGGPDFMLQQFTNTIGPYARHTPYVAVLVGVHMAVSGSGHYGDSTYSVAITPEVSDWIYQKANPFVRW